MAALNRIFGAALLCLAACGEDAARAENETPAPASEPDGIAAPELTVDGKADTANAFTNIRYAFVDAPLADYTKVDHAAVPFLSTAVLQRSNDYNDLAPGVVSLLKPGKASKVLIELLKGLTRWNDVVDDDFAHWGFEACARELPFSNPFSDMDRNLTNALSCVLQAVEPFNWRVADIVFPDKLTLDLRFEPGFPNGRILDENITDLFFAIAFIKQDLRSPLGVFHSRGECDGKRCDRFVLADLPMNPSNDVPFRSAFPYMGEAHR